MDIRGNSLWQATVTVFVHCVMALLHDLVTIGHHRSDESPYTYSIFIYSRVFTRVKTNPLRRWACGRARAPAAGLPPPHLYGQQGAGANIDTAANKLNWSHSALLDLARPAHPPQPPGQHHLRSFRLRLRRQRPTEAYGAPWCKPLRRHLEQLPVCGQATIGNRYQLAMPPPALPRLRSIDGMPLWRSAGGVRDCLATLPAALSAWLDDALGRPPLPAGLRPISISYWRSGRCGWMRPTRFSIRATRSTGRACRRSATGCRLPLCQSARSHFRMEHDQQRAYGRHTAIVPAPALATLCRGCRAAAISSRPSAWSPGRQPDHASLEAEPTAKAGLPRSRWYGGDCCGRARRGSCGVALCLCHSSVATAGGAGVG